MITSFRTIILLFFAVIATSASAKGEPAQASKPNPCFSDFTQSYIKPAALLTWANEAAVAVYSYNFVNYETQLQSASNYFTPEGWKTYSESFKQSDNFKSMILNKLIVSGVTSKAPIILQQEVLNGYYSWHVQMPMVIAYQSATEFVQEDVLVTMVIARSAPEKGVKGIGIVKLTAERIKDKNKEPTND